MLGNDKNSVKCYTDAESAETFSPASSSTALRRIKYAPEMTFRGTRIMLNASASYPGIDNSTIVRQATSTRPLIRLIESNGLQLIVKDFSRNGFFFRNIFGRFLVWREARAYRKLSGLNGVPQLLDVVDGPALVLEAVPGMAVKEAMHKRKIDLEFFDVLRELIDRIHERGVVHCDLKTAANILVSHDGHPVIIDWAASISKSEFGFFPLTLIYNRFLSDDNKAITKQRLRYYKKAGVAPVENKEGHDQRSRTEKAIRAVRDRLRRFLQKVV